MVLKATAHLPVLPLRQPGCAGCWRRYPTVCRHHSEKAAHLFAAARANECASRGLCFVKPALSFWTSRFEISTARAEGGFYGARAPHGQIKHFSASRTISLRRLTSTECLLSMTAISSKRDRPL